MVGTVLWREQSEAFRHWLATTTIRCRPGEAGVEGDIWVLSSPGSPTPAYVVKVRNRGIVWDLGLEYGVLERARRLGLPVPTPAGWGHDRAGHPVLASQYAGVHAWEVGSGGEKSVYFRRFAEILAAIHRANPAELGLKPQGLGPSFRRRPYYPMLSERGLDLVEAVCARVSTGPTRLVHGDYNFSNLLVDQAGGLTVIDWGEARADDPRYDTAWAAAQTSLYHGHEAYATFMDAYTSSSDVVAAPEDRKLLEALAALRSGHWSHADGPGSLKRMQWRDAFVATRLPDDLRRAWTPLPSRGD